jgi:GTP-binding protein YchF
MGFNCGIVGLPNVGKSTIFSALTAVQAEAANYPFCTIEPNTGVVPVPDERLPILAKMAGSQKIIPTTVEFVDIAGLVEGASKGEGLGNQFLGHIRSVDAIVHVVRCFEDSNIIHVYGNTGPKRDVEVIETELMLSDLQTTDKRLERVQKSAKTGDKLAQAELPVLEAAKLALDSGKMASVVDDPDGYLRILGLITVKPVLFVANVAEGDAAMSIESAPSGSLLSELADVAKVRNAEVVVISGAVESEIAQLPEVERREFLDSIGLKNSGLDRLAIAAYKLLKLITFFTIGPKEAHAWTCLSTDTAPVGAGKIHSDFEKGFIRAEVVSSQDYIAFGGEQGAKEKGLLRVEGKTYVMNDGDIVHFRFNV